MILIISNSCRYDTFFSRVGHKLNGSVESDARGDKYSENFQDIWHATSCKSQNYFGLQGNRALVYGID